MEKTIDVIMCEDRCIKIKVNGDEKITIDSQNRSISAEDIYCALDFAPGNHYLVQSENPSNVDGQVLEFFYDLLKTIAQKVNAISTSSGN